MKLLSERSNVDEDCVLVQGLVLDRLLKATRPAGNHLYNARLLKRLGDFKLTQEGPRPEFSYVNRLAKEHACHWYQSEHMIGWHDFGQSVDDLYAKYRLHLIKHPRIAEILEFNDIESLPLEEQVGRLALSDHRTHPKTMNLSRKGWEAELSRLPLRLRNQQDQFSLQEFARLPALEFTNSPWQTEIYPESRLRLKRTGEIL
jgi:hypothetical protein